MTHKRFVKLLMSKGYGRNDANAEARVAVSRGVTYDMGYFYILCKKYGLVTGDWSESVENVVCLIREQIDKAVRAFNEIIPIVIEAITASLPQLIANIESLRQESETAKE